jgi:hypothetical protein
MGGLVPSRIHIDDVPAGSGVESAPVYCRGSVLGLTIQVDEPAAFLIHVSDDCVNWSQFAATYRVTPKNQATICAIDQIGNMPISYTFDVRPYKYFKLFVMNWAGTTEKPITATYTLVS